ncbi:MAG: alpha-L-fucosidase [Halanaerobiaceae bacterium]
MKYKPTWSSLRTHITPKWFQKAKFGIYTHWGVYSVPACGPNGTWYPYNMYRKGTSQYKYHLKNYGDPAEFGYKDFIPMFTGDKFDAVEWAKLFKKAGAQFAGPVGEHHDGFAMWDSKETKWNAAQMGPRCDVVGELEKAIRKQGLRFMVAMHHAENWWFYPHWEEKYDTSDPEYSDLYGSIHNQEWAENVPETKNMDLFEFWELQDKPDKEFLDMWLNKIIEIIDIYSPDLLWFDNGIKFIQEHYKKEFLSYYYNKEKDWNKGVVVTYKGHQIVPDCGVVDLELGRFNKLTYHDWITDTTVDDGSGWGYISDTEYKTATTLIHYLIDNVSKNGYMLLNVGPKPNGEIPKPAQKRLLEIGKWLEVNGEAIYGTSPWLVYGEGPTNIKNSGEFNEKEKIQYTSEDIRFTIKDNYLYVICLGWPKKDLIIKTLSKKLYKSEIKSIEMLGTGQKLSWKMTHEGLKIENPSEKPCDHAYVFKIARKFPF